MDVPCHLAEGMELTHHPPPPPAQAPHPARPLGTQGPLGAEMESHSGKHSVNDETFQSFGVAECDKTSCIPYQLPLLSVL